MASGESKISRLLVALALQDQLKFRPRLRPWLQMTGVDPTVGNEGAVLDAAARIIVRLAN